MLSSSISLPERLKIARQSRKESLLNDASSSRSSSRSGCGVGASSRRASSGSGRAFSLTCDSVSFVCPRAIVSPPPWPSGEKRPTPRIGCGSGGGAAPLSEAANLVGGAAARGTAPAAAPVLRLVVERPLALMVRADLDPAGLPAGDECDVRGRDLRERPSPAARDRLERELACDHAAPHGGAADVLVERGEVSARRLDEGAQPRTELAQLAQLVRRRRRELSEAAAGGEGREPRRLLELVDLAAGPAAPPLRVDELQRRVHGWKRNRLSAT